MVGLTGYVIVSILFDPITGQGGIIEMAIATELLSIVRCTNSYNTSLGEKTQNGQIEELRQEHKFCSLFC
jgi:hypothetical protein